MNVNVPMGPPNLITKTKSIKGSNCKHFSISTPGYTRNNIGVKGLHPPGYTKYNTGLKGLLPTGYTRYNTGVKGTVFSRIYWI